MIAETLTLADCISALDPVLARGASVLQAADDETARAIPPTAFMSSDAAWREALVTIFGIKIGEIFKSACFKLSSELPTAETTADGAANITLLPFVIESSHHPTIVVTWGVIAVPLKFDIELNIEVEGAQLHVKDGRTTGASTGAAKGVARISLLNAQPPFELGSPSFELPGELEFAATEVTK
jgi:hypothetical protein